WCWSRRSTRFSRKAGAVCGGAASTPKPRPGARNQHRHDENSRTKPIMKRVIVILFIIAAIGAGAGAYYMRQGKSEPTVNTSPITRGDVIDTVGATGTLQAVTTVQVGSQVSGNISELGADFNSIVKKR